MHGSVYGVSCSLAPHGLDLDPGMVFGFVYSMHDLHQPGV